MRAVLEARLVLIGKLLADPLMRPLQKEVDLSTKGRASRRES